MASKIIARIGTKAQFLAMPVPLLVGEYGYETDTRNGVVGDGSTTPPEFMTTKSNGSFDFTGTTTVAFNNITANSYSGVNLAQIDSTNGFIVRTGKGTFSARTFTSSDSSIKVTNPDGVQGNPNIQINPNLDLSVGTSGLVIPQGTTAQRPANPEIGCLRYCIDPGQPTCTPEIFATDQTWHSIKGFVYNTDYTLTVNPNASSNSLLTYTTIQQALLAHLLTDCSGKSITSIPEGVFNCPNAIKFTSPNKQWSIQGVTPLTANLTSVAGVTGTNGLWTVVLNLDNVSGINIGNYLVVDSLRGYSTQPHRGQCSVVSGANTISASFPTTDPTLFTYDINPNDYVSIVSNSNTFANSTVQKYIGQVQAIPNSSTLVMKNGVPFTNSYTPIYCYFGITGAIYSNPNNPTNIIGVGTIFTSELNVNDILTINNETKQIIGISSDSSLTVANPPLNWPTTANNAVMAYANNNPELHQGALKVVAVDVVNKKVTVINNNIHQPPVNKLGVGTVRVIKSVISFTNPADDGFQVMNGATVDLQSVVVISASGTGTYGLNVSGSAITLEDVYLSGFNNNFGAGISLSQKSSCLALNSNSSVMVTNCTNGFSLNSGSIFYSSGQVVVSCCSLFGINMQTGSYFMCYNTTSGPWKCPLSVFDCTGINNSIWLNALSYLYASIMHVAYGTNSSAIALYNNSCLTTYAGMTLHDCTQGGIGVSNHSYAAINYSSILNLYIAYTAITANGNSSVSFGNSFISNVNSFITVGDSSVIVISYSILVYSTAYPIFTTGNTQINARGSIIQIFNTSLNNATIVGLFNASTAVFDYAQLTAPNNTVYMITASNGCYVTALGTTFTNSTLLSPPRNTVGNNNSYIAN